MSKTRRVRSCDLALSQDGGKSHLIHVALSQDGDHRVVWSVGEPPCHNKSRRGEGQKAGTENKKNCTMPWLELKKLELKKPGSWLLSRAKIVKTRSTNTQDHVEKHPLSTGGVLWSNWILATQKPGRLGVPLRAGLNRNH